MAFSGFQHPRIHWPTLGALLWECALAWGCTAWVATHWGPVAVVLGMVFIATRQHALFILYHDAVHGLLARPIRLNDLLINQLVGVPQLLPIHLYRSLHLVHHSTLGTERDPERLLLYAGQDWNYRPLRALPLARQLLGDLLLWNNLKTALKYVQHRRDPNSPLRLPKVRVFPELGLQFALWIGLAIGVGLWDPGLLLRLGVLWFVPLLTLTQAIQKVRSFAEHAGLDAPELSYSWAPGWLGRALIWPYNIQYHREHHIHPSVPWDELPGRFPDRVARPGWQLLGLLWAGARYRR